MDNNKYVIGVKYNNVNNVMSMICKVHCSLKEIYLKTVFILRHCQSRPRESPLYSKCPSLILIRGGGGGAST